MGVNKMGNNKIKMYNTMLIEIKQKLSVKAKKQERSNIRKERSTFVDWYNDITNHKAKAKRLR